MFLSLREKCPYSEFFWSAFYFLAYFTILFLKYGPEKLRIKTLFTQCIVQPLLSLDGLVIFVLLKSMYLECDKTSPTCKKRLVRTKMTKYALFHLRKLRF